MKQSVSIMWFRRDLRLTDNAALYHALRGGTPVLPVFIFDRNILDQLEDKADRRVAFIHAALHNMQAQLLAMGSTLEVLYGYPADIFRVLTDRYEVKQVYTNQDYEPYALERETQIEKILQQQGIAFHAYKDHVIFEKNEVLKEDGTPYTVFTPYANKWKLKLNDFYLSSYPAEKCHANFFRQPEQPLPSLESIGFRPGNWIFPPGEWDETLFKQYAESRDYPSLEKGTSKLGVHLRFGTISIRTLAQKAKALSSVYLNELIWRDFYHMILWHFPQVGKGKSFKPRYDLIEWRNQEKEFQAWCEGRTGYPIVDAGMRELNTTGYMHNRVRMITASFLTKHLLIDWRWGEAYFAQKLLDFDLAANNGGWQWASGSGCDAAPYFRVFNPALQTGKFDKELRYVKKWVPEFQEWDYPQPIVQHELARKLALEVYAKALQT